MKKIFCRVESVALTLLKIMTARKTIEPKYSRELLKMLPLDLYQTMITEGNISRIMARIDCFRREKEDQLAQVMGLGFNWEENLGKKKKLHAFLDNPYLANNLSIQKESLRRQVMFLSALSRSIHKLIFIKK